MSKKSKASKPKGSSPKGSGVVVLVDGWNLHRGCERAFGSGPVHPLALGRELAGKRALLGVRYYIGVPDARVDPENASLRDRQLAFMERTGVEVFRKKLRYRWEWKFNKWDLPNPAGRENETHTVEVKAHQQGREKGVDTWLALDAFRAASRREVDVVVIVSADSDLDLVASEVHDAATARVENAVVNSHGKKIINRAFRWSHQIDQAMFDAVQDTWDHHKKMSSAVQRRRLRELGLPAS